MLCCFGRSTAPHGSNLDVAADALAAAGGPLPASPEPQGAKPGTRHVQRALLEFAQARLQPIDSGPAPDAAQAFTTPPALLLPDAHSSSGAGPGSGATPGSVGGSVRSKQSSPSFKPYSLEEWMRHPHSGPLEPMAVPGGQVASTMRDHITVGSARGRSQEQLPALHHPLLEQEVECVEAGYEPGGSQVQKGVVVGRFSAVTHSMPHSRGQGEVASSAVAAGDSTSDAQHGAECASEVGAGKQPVPAMCVHPATAAHPPVPVAPSHGPAASQQQVPQLQAAPQPQVKTVMTVAAGTRMQQHTVIPGAGSQGSSSSTSTATRSRANEGQGSQAAGSGDVCHSSSSHTEPHSVGSVTFDVAADTPYGARDSVDVARALGRIDEGGASVRPPSAALHVLPLPTAATSSHSQQPTIPMPPSLGVADCWPATPDTPNFALQESLIPLPGGNVSPSPSMLPGDLPAVCTMGQGQGLRGPPVTRVAAAAASGESTACQQESSSHQDATLHNWEAEGLQHGQQADAASSSRSNPGNHAEQGTAAASTHPPTLTPATGAAAQIRCAAEGLSGAVPPHRLGTLSAAFFPLDGGTSPAGLSAQLGAVITIPTGSVTISNVSNSSLQIGASRHSSSTGGLSAVASGGFRPGAVSCSTPWWGALLSEHNTSGGAQGNTSGRRYPHTDPVATAGRQPGLRATAGPHAALGWVPPPSDEENKDGDIVVLGLPGERGPRSRAVSLSSAHPSTSNSGSLTGGSRELALGAVMAGYSRGARAAASRRAGGLSGRSGAGGPQTPREMFELLRAQQEAAQRIDSRPASTRSGGASGGANGALGLL